MVTKDYVSRGYLTRDITIIDKQGIHARPSAYTVKLCCKYPQEIEAYLEKIDDESKDIVDTRNVMEILTLGAEEKSRIRIHIKEGFRGSQAMLEELAEFLSGDFEKAREEGKPKAAKSKEEPQSIERSGWFKSLFRK
jgi:phosphotransferase system HPr (HPr) family protein